MCIRDSSYNQDTLKTLAENYYASSFQGNMGDEAYTQALRDWLNEQTGGLLQEQAEGIQLRPETVLALATTLYYKAGWSDEFNPENTATQTFHAPSGDVEAEFLHQTSEDDLYYQMCIRDSFVSRRQITSPYFILSSSIRPENPSWTRSPGSTARQHFCQIIQISLLPL